jgi:hypothetical protein
MEGGFFPWSSTEGWTAVAACLLIGIYAILSISFLQPFLGDAARYFRNAPGNVKVRREIRKLAVDALAGLHSSKKYDRIIVIAHSLGIVIAYDMLRSYFARICRHLPTDEEELGADFHRVDFGAFHAPTFRSSARRLVRSIAKAVEQAEREPNTKTELKAWLVTDFVTLGSPLTHALYLMCPGPSKERLLDYFNRGVREREFPKCPPEQTDEDGRLTFIDPNSKRRFHHGALFGLTRWKNLFFPMSQLLWGDAIGGPVAPLFGSGVCDIPVVRRHDKKAERFTHTKYWETEPEGPQLLPHIRALRMAVDLADAGDDLPTACIIDSQSVKSKHDHGV